MVFGQNIIEVLQPQNLRVTSACLSLLTACFIEQDTGGDC